MAYQLKYEESYVGARLTAEKDGAQVFDGLQSEGVVYSVKKSTQLILTGYYYYDGKYTNYLQTTGGLYVYINTYDGTQNDWSIQEGAVKLRTYTETQAQALVRKIFNNNIVIVQNNLVCARFANKFTAEQRQQIRELQRRCEARKAALTSQGLCDHIETSYPKGYADLEPYLDKLMAGESVGIATWAVVVIAAVVIAGLGTAAYFAYKELADESEKDVKYSKELTAILTSKLTDEEYQQLLSETKGIVTKARLKQSIFGNAKWLLGIAAVGLGWFVVKKIKNSL